MIEEQLFVDEPKFNASKNNYQVVFMNDTDSNSNIGRFCTCEDQASSTDSLEDFYTVHCNLTESTEQCSSSDGSSDRSTQYTSCLQPDARQRRSLKYLHTLNKRSLDENDDFVDSQPLSYDEDVNDTEAEVQLYT